jgi:hypothetical protein
MGGFAIIGCLKFNVNCVKNTISACRFEKCACQQSGRQQYFLNTASSHGLTECV